MRTPTPDDGAVIFPDDDGWISRYTLAVGRPNQVIHILLWAEIHPTPIPKTGLSAAAGLRAFAIRPTDRSPVALTLAEEPASGDRCRFWEIDPVLMPGLYGLQIPSAFRPSGHTYIALHFPGTQPRYLELDGVCFDPHDVFSMGLENWIRSSCVDDLASGLRKSLPSVLRPLLLE